MKGKKAIITGGTSGIGAAIVSLFVEEGIQVAFFGTNEARANGLIASLKEKGPSPLFFAVDVANFEQVQAAVEEAKTALGGVDILINCAGITKDQLLLRMKEEEWDEVIDVNLKSAFNMCKAVLKPMMKQRSGKIINISSVIGIIGNPGQVNYSASKAGMIGFTQSLAKELGSRNIHVNCIAPGFIQTKMTDTLTEDQKKNMLNAIPMKRFGTPENVARLCKFLASSDSDYITGEVIAIDGGMTA